MKVRAIGEPQNGVQTYQLRCPGCGNPAEKGFDPFAVHTFNSTWTYNGDADKPTISPSLLVTGHDPNYRCHSFVRDGRIEFLSDCSHSLAGQTVDLPELDT